MNSKFKKMKLILKGKNKLFSITNNLKILKTIYQALRINS